MTTDSISLLTALRASEGLVVALVLCIGSALVLTLIGLIMRRAGASLRPIIFIAGLMLPIMVPLLIGQLVLARVPVPAAPSAALAVSEGRFVDREKLFGPGIPAELIRDAQSGLPGILDEAEVAEVGVSMSGETVLIAQFPGDEITKRAAGAYHRGYQLRNSSGDEENGWRATRMQGDYIEMLRTGRQLFVWSGLTKEAAAARRAASDLAAQFASPGPAPRPPLFPALQPLADFFAPISVKVLGMVLLVFIYTLWFFKGVGWASSSAAIAGEPILPASELVSRLMSINALDVPFTIGMGKSPNELIADWRYADAKWIDLTRAHGVRKTFRIRLSLDEAARTVRATDYTATFDWSAGRNGASIEWQAAMGVVFFQKEQQRVFGLQIDDQGRLKPELSYSYRFDLNEMKSPIMTAITKAGWNWRPTVWQGPKWLRWLTDGARVVSPDPLNLALPILTALTMTIPDQHTQAIAEFPRVLQDLIRAELAAGNSIVEIGPGHPAPMNGAQLMLAKPLLSRPRASDEQIKFYARNSSSYSAEITDAERTFFILEAPLPPPPEADMDAIRDELEARERAANAEGWDH